VKRKLSTNHTMTTASSTTTNVE